MLIRRTAVPRMIVSRHTHHVPVQLPSGPLRTRRTRVTIAIASLTTIGSLGALSTSASATEFYPVPALSASSLCKNGVNVTDLFLSNTGTDVAHFSIQWGIGGSIGIDTIDVAAGEQTTKEYTQPEDTFATFVVNTPGQPPLQATVNSYADCLANPTGAISLVCPTDGSSAYLHYAYGNDSIVGADFALALPDGTVVHEVLTKADGPRTKDVSVTEDAVATGHIDVDGASLTTFSQTVNCAEDIATTTTTVPETTIPATTVPPDTIPATTVAAIVPVPVVEQLPPTTSTAPQVVSLPATGRSSGGTAALAAGLLLLGLGCVVIARRTPRATTGRPTGRTV